MFYLNHRPDRRSRPPGSSATRAKSRRGRTRVGLHLRPVLEQLEDRTLLAVCSTTGTVPPGFIQLDYDGFHASGRGDVTTAGIRTERTDQIRVDDASTWCQGHGIRIQRAGKDDQLHNADSGWTEAMGAPAGVFVTHDPVEKIEGAASVHTTFAGPDPGAPVNLSEVDLLMPVNFPSYDELRFWIRSSRDISTGDLEIRTFDASRLPRFAMVIPGLAVNTWTEVFLRIESRVDYDNLAGVPQFLTLRCIRSCADLDIHMDDFWLVRDLIGEVVDIHSLPDGKAVFDLDRPIEADRPTPNLPVYTVFHDDTLAAKKWLDEARWLDEAAGAEANLFAPPGVYYINQQQLPLVESSLSLPIYSNTRLQGAGSALTTFKNTGGAWNGPGLMLRSFDPNPVNITIEDVGFDWNGWNLLEFGSVITIVPPTSSGHAENIHIARNRFFDSNFPGLERCDSNEDCETRQRHHVLVRKVDGVWIEHNSMSGGGRIKAGGIGLGVNMYIRNNVLDFVNDNAITILDTVPGLTANVEISDNTIINPVTTGIAFGADGELNWDVFGMVVRDVTIARNRISGHLGRGARIQGLLPPTLEAETGRIQIMDNVIEIEAPAQQGIALGRPLNAIPATAIRVERNAILASGPEAQVSDGAIVLHGSMSDVRIRANEVRCDDCGFIQSAGIWLKAGAFDNVAVDGNTIVGAHDALHIGFGLGTPRDVRITNLHIRDNDFDGSRSPALGQITVDVNPGEVVQARIEKNHIHAGAGHGIATRGDGHFDLTIIKNLITNNGHDGVNLGGGSGILISKNSIFNNGGLGIDLVGGMEDSFGVTANDSEDADSGPNQLQNFPRIISAVRDRSRTIVRGTINTNPTGDVTIEFFVKPTCDESGYGEGESFVGRIVVRDVAPSDLPDGTREFAANLGRLPVGWFLTATASDSRGNSSEFSRCVAIGAIDRIRPGAAARSTGLPAVNRLTAARAAAGYQARSGAEAAPVVARAADPISSTAKPQSATMSRRSSAALTSRATPPFQTAGIRRNSQPGPQPQHTSDELSTIDSLLETGLTTFDMVLPM